MNSWFRSIALTLGVVLASHAAAAEHNPVAREPRPVASGTDVILGLREDAQTASAAKLLPAGQRTLQLARRTGLILTTQREISPSLVAVRIDSGAGDVSRALERLRADSAVAFVAPDRRRYAHATPNDSLFLNQWYLGATEAAAVNATAAWDQELGSAGVVVAVLDTGVLYDHPDLGRADRGGKLLPGYDFVSASHMVNDGGGRDANPSDPGDWISSDEKSGDALYEDCDVTDSTWHGTRVAGMIGALTDNAAGVAGLSWNSYILPVRVLGKCGGADSDILAGMRWAAGLSVPGAPLNPTPARILNLSLGSTSPCEPGYRAVIEELTARKVLVVISAGNEGTIVSSPANCPGVAAIAALRHAGSKVGFSNLGPEVTLGAPGGNCVNINGGPCLFSLDTTSNSGSTDPGAHGFTDQFNSNLGTSFSAPIVSGIAALMISRNGNLSTRQVLERLRESARPFPAAIPAEPGLPVCHVPVDENDVQLAQCVCTTQSCGAGMADAARSVTAAARPIAAIVRPVSVFPGQNVALDASGSAAACGRDVAGYEWSVVAPSTNPPPIVGAGTATASVIAPVSGSITLRLTVTDDQGRSDSADVVIETGRTTSSAPAIAGSAACTPPVVSGVTPGSAVPAPTPVPSPAPSRVGGGGGGGESGFGLLGFLAMLATVRGVRRFFNCN